MYYPQVGVKVPEFQKWPDRRQAQKTEDRQGLRTLRVPEKSESGFGPAKGMLIPEKDGKQTSGIEPVCVPFDARVHPHVRTQTALQKTWEHLRLHAGSLQAGTLQSDRVLPCVLSCG